VPRQPDEKRKKAEMIARESSPAAEISPLPQLRSLREQVYEYLRDEMNRGVLTPGSTINLNGMSSRLGVSKTPLRDALIQLESEGFVTILPRRYVVVNQLTLDDIRQAYEIAGALEGSAVQSAFHKFERGHIGELERLNKEMLGAIRARDFDRYYQLNLSFHDVFLNLSGNAMLRRIVMPIKRRLYDFPRRGYIKEWELRNCDEHEAFVQCIKEGDREGAVKIIRDLHWSFAAQEDFIRRFYLQKTAEGNV